MAGEERPVTGRYYEDLEPGTVVRHALSRTVTETDNLLFTALTHNVQPLHLDAEFARSTLHGRTLVNSIFTLGLLGGIPVADTTMGTTLGNLGFEEVRFPNPVFVGDTISVTTTVLERRPSNSRPEYGIVTFRHEGHNQRGELVATCRRAALMKRAPGGEEPA